MSYVIFTDTSANLPSAYLKERGINVIPFSYNFHGQELTCLDTESFDGETYYSDIRAGENVRTSQISPQLYIDAFTPWLEQGKDILFVGMSSGISGSFNSSCIAASQLEESFPERKIRLVDTLAASLGEGILVMHAADLRDEGLSIDENYEFLLQRLRGVYQVVMLEDLMYLHRGGRISGAKAILGTVLGVRPILKGNSNGELIVISKARGRKAALSALFDKYVELVHEPEKQRVGIAYTDKREQAEALADMINKAKPPKELMLVCYEPVTGSHVGPGTVALFFEGKDGVREL